MNTNILIAVRVEQNMAVYFPRAAMEEIRKLGHVTVLDVAGRTEADLAAALPGTDVCMTHWGCPRFTAAVLDHAPELKLIAHCTGSVANIVSDAVYNRGIKVCSANDVMAKYVAEGALAYILCGLKLITKHDNWMKQGELWRQDESGIKSLFGARLGLVGLGAVGRHLLRLLEPFGVSVRLYDPYVSTSDLAAYPNVSLCSLEEALAWGDIVSIHASLTGETRHMVDASGLRLIRDGALLVNTGRGAIIDEAALVKELSLSRFTAVLDVYEQEPLPLESPLRQMENVVLMPHMAGYPVRERMTYAMIEEIRRYQSSAPLCHEIPYGRYRLMTRE